MPTNPDINQKHLAFLLKKFPALKRLSQSERTIVVKQASKILKKLQQKASLN